LPADTLSNVSTILPPCLTTSLKLPSEPSPGASTSTLMSLPVVPDWRAATRNAGLPFSAPGTSAEAVGSTPSAPTRTTYAAPPPFRKYP